MKFKDKINTDRRLAVFLHVYVDGSIHVNKESVILSISCSAGTEINSISNVI